MGRKQHINQETYSQVIKIYGKCYEENGYYNFDERMKGLSEEGKFKLRTFVGKVRIKWFFFYNLFFKMPSVDTFQTKSSESQIYYMFCFLPKKYLLKCTN